MKALVLENDPVVTGTVLNFITEHARTFKSVAYLTLLQHRKMEEINNGIREADAIIFESQFHLRKQMENLLHLIMTDFKDKNLKIYSVNFLKHLNEILRYDPNSAWPDDFKFSNFEQLKINLITLISKGNVYDVMSVNDYLGEPELEGMDGKTIFHRVRYDKRKRIFRWEEKTS